MNTESRNTSDAFFSGCKEGLKLALYGILPRVMVAFILISILQATGIMELISKAFAPVMQLWSLPGESAVVLATAPTPQLSAPLFRCLLPAACLPQMPRFSCLVSI